MKSSMPATLIMMFTMQNSPMMKKQPKKAKVVGLKWKMKIMQVKNI